MVSVLLVLVNIGATTLKDGVCVVSAQADDLAGADTFISILEGATSYSEDIVSNLPQIPSRTRSLL